ncbi:hypothetical protein ACIRP0_36000 [Streptomyces sp. NPDC101733]|uniref:hypothetical protein n=1 Tax=unclassified Streptomyces TaxID=2593676 RepID=UPI003817E54F
MRLGARLLTLAAAGALLVGCSSTPAEKLQDWWSSGGDDRVKTLSDTSGRVNTASVQTMDDKGAACQELLTAVAKAKKLGTPPTQKGRDFWADAMTAFEHGGNECVTGVGKKDEPQTNEGIREVQRGLSSLAAAVSMIRIDIKDK